MLAALVVLATAGRRGYRILREGRTPPTGEKVFRPTRIRRGRSARLAGRVQLLAFIVPLALAAWGAGQAEPLARQAQARTARLAPIPDAGHPGRAPLAVYHDQQGLGLRLARIADGVVQVGGIARGAAQFDLLLVGPDFKFH